MSKIKRVLYIITVATVSAVLMFSTFIPAGAETSAAPSPVLDKSYFNNYGNEGEYYEFTSPFEGYDYYFIINSTTKYDIYFVTNAWDNFSSSYSTGFPMFGNPSTSSGYSTVDLGIIPGGVTVYRLVVLFSDLETYFPDLTYLQAISNILLSGKILKLDYVTNNGLLSSFTYSWDLTTSNFYSTTSTPYVLKFTPIVAGNFKIYCPIAFSGGSYDSSYGRTFSPDTGLYDVFKDKAIYDMGHTNGYDLGNYDGYYKGLDSNYADVTGFNVLSGALSSVMEIFNMQIFGYFSLGDVVSVVLVFGVVFFVFKLIRG